MLLSPRRSVHAPGDTVRQHVAPTDAVTAARADRRDDDPRAVVRRRPKTAAVAAARGTAARGARDARRLVLRVRSRPAAASGDPRGRHTARRRQVHHHVVQGDARAGYRGPRSVRQGHTAGGGRHVQVHAEGRQVRGH